MTAITLFGISVWLTDSEPERVFLLCCSSSCDRFVITFSRFPEYLTTVISIVIG